MSTKDSKASYAIEVFGKNGKVPHQSGLTVNPDTARNDYFNLQSGIKNITEVVIRDKQDGKFVAKITPKDFTKNTGNWVVSDVAGLTTIKRQDASDKSGKIDMRLDFTQAVKTVLVALNAEFKASRAFGGQLSDETTEKIKEMRALGLSDAQIAKFLDKKVDTVSGVK